MVYKAMISFSGILSMASPWQKGKSETSLTPLLPKNS